MSLHVNKYSVKMDDVDKEDSRALLDKLAQAAEDEDKPKFDKAYIEFNDLLFYLETE